MASKKRPDTPPDPLGPIGKQERESARDITERLEAMVNEAVAGTTETQASFLADVFDDFETVIGQLASDVASRYSVALLEGPAAWRHLDAEGFDYVLERYCHAKTLRLTLGALAVAIVTALEDDPPDLRLVVELVRPTYSEIGARGLYVWYMLARTESGRMKAQAKLAAPTIGRLSTRNRRLVKALSEHRNFRRGLISEVPGAIVSEIDEAFKTKGSPFRVAGRPRNAPKPFLVNLRNRVAQHIERQHATDGVRREDIEETAAAPPVEAWSLPIDTDRSDSLEEMLAGLTPRERQVAELLSQGDRPIEIARKMGVTRQTVNTLRNRIARKLRPTA